MEADLPPFPHSKDTRHHLLPLEEKEKAHPKPTSSSFQSRFPWLSFTNPHHRKQFIFQGRQTERVRPFLLKFDLKQAQATSPHVHHSLREFTQAVVELSPSFSEEVRKGKYSEQVRVGPEGVVSQGYLLTGIAKPTTSADSFFNAFFGEYILLQEEQNKKEGSLMSEQEDDISDMSGEGSGKDQTPRGYSFIRKSWEAKLSSYEYLKFMSGLYARHLQEMGHDTVCKELFWIGQSRCFHYLDKHTMIQVQIGDRQYFDYFSRLLKKHGLQIHSQISLFESKNPYQHKHSLALECGLSLRKINFEKVTQKCFSNCHLSKEEVKRISHIQQQKHLEILSNFELTPKKKRLEKIAALQQVGPNFEVEVVPLREEGLATEEQVDSYLIVVSKYDQCYPSNPSQEASLDEILNLMKNGELSVMDTSLEQIRQRFFYSNIFRHIQALGDFPCPSLLQCMSLNPRHIVFDGHSGDCDINLDFAIESFLGLSELPLSQEQQMLEMTPGPLTDPFQMFVQLKQDLYPKEIGIKWGSSPDQMINNYYSSLCEAMSGHELKFTFSRQRYDMAFQEQDSISRMDKGSQFVQKRFEHLQQGIQRAANFLQSKESILARFEGAFSFKELSSLQEGIVQQITTESSKLIRTQQVFQLLLLTLIHNSTHKNKLLSTSQQPPHELLLPPSSENASHHSEAVDPLSEEEAQKKTYQICLIVFLLSGVTKFIECQSVQSEEGSLLSTYDGENIQKFVKQYLGILKEYLKLQEKGRIGSIRGENKDDARKMSREVHDEGKFFSKMAALYNQLLGMAWSNHTFDFLKMTLNAAFVLHQYRAWLFLLQSILAIERQRQDKDSKELQELRLTLQEVYKQMRLQDSKVSLGEEKKKQEFSGIRTILQKADENRKVQNHFRSSIDSYLPFHVLVEKVRFILHNDNQKAKDKRHELLLTYDFTKTPLEEHLGQEEKLTQEQLTILFCHLHSRRRRDHDRIEELNQDSQREKENEKTTKLLAFFLYGQQGFRKGCLQNLKDERLDKQGWDHYLQWLSQHMLMKISLFMQHQP